MGGISLDEMNMLENQFTTILDYNFFVKPEDFNTYLQKLTAYDVINEWRLFTPLYILNYNPIIHIIMHQLPLLFSFDLLSLAFLPHFDPLHHILLEQPTPATFKVLKNAQQLKALFRLFEQPELLPVCYSSKSFKQTAPVMSSINPALKWAYVHVDNKKLPSVRPNHARLSKVNDTLVIEYG